MKKTLLTIFVFSLAIYCIAGKENNGETRSATVTVDISESDLINVQAKNTELTIETWDKNQVQIVANVRYDGKMTDKIEEFLNNFEKLVKENVKKTSGEVLIDSELYVSGKNMKKSFFGLVVEINLDDDKLKLQYNIKAPGANKYKINNSYEDVTLIGRYQNVDLQQYSSDLEAGAIENAKLELKYGSANIQRVGTLEATIYEQKIEINHAGNLDLDAKYSEVEIDHVNKISTEAYESDLNLYSIKELTGELKYGEINIDEVLEFGELILYEVDIDANKIEELSLKDSKYCKFKIKSIDELYFDESYEDEIEIQTLSSFKSLNSKYGNHSIGILKASFNLDAYEDDLEINKIDKKVSTIAINGKYMNLTFDMADIPYSLSANVKYGKVDYDESKVDVKKIIKDSDQLELEIYSKNKTDDSVNISVTGYEIDVELD
ncbi:MAG: hypothetical protein AAFY41_03020 [Bacteroidota bacterium]